MFAASASIVFLATALAASCLICAVPNPSPSALAVVQSHFVAKPAMLVPTQPFPKPIPSLPYQRACPTVGSQYVFAHGDFLDLDQAVLEFVEISPFTMVLRHDLPMGEFL
jgi:hypothetical protein